VSKKRLEAAAMICSKCKKTNSPNMKFCDTCGTPVPPSELKKRVEAKPSRQFIFKGIKFHTPDEDSATATVGRLILDANILFKSLAALLLLAFFMPIFRVVFIYEDAAYNISGFHTSFGWDANNGTVFGFFVFAVPILIFSMLQFKNRIVQYIPFLRDRFSIIILVFALIGLAFLFLSYRGLTRPYISVWPFWGFFVLFLLYVLIGAVAVGFIIAKNRK